MRTERALPRTLAHLLLAAAALLAFHCQSAREEPTGGETHFLQRCSETSATCGSELVCACGVCTIPCTGPTACDSFPDASCVTPTGGTGCAASSETYCDVPCATATDCATLSPDHRCEFGFCRRSVPVSACTPDDAVAANQLVLIGDSFFAVDHGITAFLEDLARSNGAISAGERYRDYSSVVDNTLALVGAGITAQYARARTEGAVRVVIMTGGGADVLLGSCERIAEDCPLLTAATTEAAALFQQMADDGVEHVVYAFYPDPTDPELRAEVGALRPLLERACEASPTPCTWVDLRGVFGGKEERYLNADGTVPTADGARASASELWSVMSARCIAE